MNISKMTTAEAHEAVSAMDTVEALREAATSIGVTFSGNTGEPTLRKKITDEIDARAVADEPTQDEALPALDGDDDFDPSEIQSTAGPVKKGPTVDEILAMNPNEITDPLLLRQVVRAKALRLHRVKVTNLDPNDSALNGAIITVFNKFTGKVAKYVPFSEEEAPNGYHVPEMILNYLKNQKFALRREIKGGQFGVKKYKTTMVNKYSIVEMPQLTKEELAELAAHQRASHAIDN
jgi:hypothetical protein